MQEILYNSIRIEKLAAVNRINSSRAECFHRENRPTNALVFKMKGKTVYKVGDVWTTSTPEVSVVLPQGSSYVITYEELGECILIEFTSYDNTLKDITSVKLKSPALIHDKVYKLLRAWEHEGETPKTLSLAYGIIAELSETNTEDYAIKSKADIIKPAVSKLHTEYADVNMNIAELSEMSGVSDVYFRRIFRECYGMPPAKYLAFYRIGKAKELLLSDGISVGEAAEAVGFSDIYVFSKAFKRIVGISPTDYIKRGGVLS